MSDQSKMLAKFINEGTRLEMQALEREDSGTENKPKIYASKICDIISEDTIEIMMPMEQQKIVLLPVDKEYDMKFYAGAMLYQCNARVIDRYKSGSMYLLLMELTSNLRKYQRREYYRFSCVLEMGARNLEEEELLALGNNREKPLQPGLPLKKCVIVDISGGGLRFISTEKYEVGSLIFCTYQLLLGGEPKPFEVLGKVLAVKEMSNRKGSYEHRLQYHNLDVHTREMIIKYIFEEERRARKK